MNASLTAAFAQARVQELRRQALAGRRRRGGETSDSGGDGGPRSADADADADQRPVIRLVARYSRHEHEGHQQPLRRAGWRARRA